MCNFFSQIGNSIMFFLEKKNLFAERLLFVFSVRKNLFPWLVISKRIELECWDWSRVKKDLVEIEIYA